MDGTGIGYKKKTNLNWMRGAGVRKVKDHIRCEVVMTKGKYKMVKYVDVGRRYSSEIKMLERIVRKIELRGKKFLADRLYDVRWLKEYLKDRRIKVVYFCLIFSHSYLIFLPLLPRFLKHLHVREEERSCMIPSTDPYQVSNLVL